MHKNTRFILSVLAFALILGSIELSIRLYQTAKLFNAVENNSLAEAQAAINRGAWIDVRRYPSFPLIEEIVVINLTPLETACKQGNEEMVTLLLENGVNTKNKNTKSTPLLNALHGTKSNRFSLTMYLVEQGADIQDPEQATFLGEDLIYISKEDSEETIQDGFTLFKHLMEQEAPIAFRFSSQHMLTLAAKCGNSNVISYLIQERYYNVDTVDPLQNTALIVASQNNQAETVALLLELGADTSLTDAHGKTALDHAAEQQNARILSLLGE